MQGRLCSCRGKQLCRLVRVRCERGSPEKTRNCELVVIFPGVSSHSSLSVHRLERVFE